MSLHHQLLSMIAKIAMENMWNTLDEQELILLKIKDQEIYCSFQGKNTPYYGIELFIGEYGQQAIAERMNQFYYPDYIYRYRQNSIMILIDGKYQADKLNEPIIKSYRYHEIPTLLSKEEQFQLMEYLSALYDCIKLMQYQNILGKFQEHYCLKYVFNQKTYQYELLWEKMNIVIKLPDAISFELNALKNNDLDVELDFFPIELNQRLVYTLVVVNKETLLYSEVFEEYNDIDQALIHFVNQFGIFNTIYVRDLYMKTRLAYLPKVIITPVLDNLDNMIEKMMEVDNYE